MFSLEVAAIIKSASDTVAESAVAKLAPQLQEMARTAAESVVAPISLRLDALERVVRNGSASSTGSANPYSAVSRKFAEPRFVRAIEIKKYVKNRKNKEEIEKQCLMDDQVVDLMNIIENA